MRTFFTSSAVLIVATIIIATMAQAATQSPRGAPPPILADSFFSAESEAVAQNGRTPASSLQPTYPLKASLNNRYLVDQNNVPFLIIGDAPQTLIANLSLEQAATYMASRRQYGVNTLWVNLLCNYSEACRKDANTFDGIPPFTTIGDLSTPNPDYFQRADDMINLAAAHQMVVLLDPIETSSWLGVLQLNGLARSFAYGEYLGNRYKSFPNIMDARQRFPVLAQR
jgi:hypothetical protein